MTVPASTPAFSPATRSRGRAVGRGPVQPTQQPTQPKPAKMHKPDALLYAILVYTWAAIWRLQDIVPILGKIQAPILCQLVIAGLFIADQKRRMKWIASPLLTMILILVVIMILGFPTSLLPGMSITFVFRELTPYIAVMAVLAASVRDMGDLEGFAFGHLVSAFIFALYTFLFCPMGWDGRIRGIPYYDANDFALLMTCTMPFAIYFMRPGVVTWKRLFALGALGLLLLMNIRSGSRGGFIGQTVLLAYVLFRYRSIPARLRIGAVVVGVAVMMLFGSDKYWKMMQTILNPKDDYNMKDDTGRKKVWGRGIHYMLTHPVTGVGVRGFPRAEGLLSPVAKRYAEMGRGIKWSVAHNSFVETGAELGIPGLIVFVSMLGFSIYSMGTLYVGRKKPPWITPEERAFGQSLAGTLVAYCICGFFISAEYFAYLYMIFGMVLGLAAILRKRAHMPPPQIPLRPTGPAPPTAPVPVVGPRRAPQLPKWKRPQWVPSGS